MTDSSSNPPISATVLTAAIFVVGVLSTLLVQNWVAGTLAHHDQDDFDREADTALDGIESVLGTFFEDLDNVVAFAGALDPPDPAQFERFVGSTVTPSPSRDDVVVYIEKVRSDELDDVVARETALRGRPFTPLTQGDADTLHLVMRSATSGAGTRLPAVDVGQVEPFATVIDRVAPGQLGLVDLAEAHAAVTASGGVTDRAPEPLVTILDQIGLIEAQATAGGSYGVLAPVENGAGSVVGYVLETAVPTAALERFATAELAISVGVRDRIGGNTSVVGRPGGPSVDDTRWTERRTVTVGGLDFDLRAYRPEPPSAVSALSELLLLVGLVVTLGIGLVAHRKMAERIRNTERRAHTDPLTGLHNRDGITDALDGVLRERREGGGLVVVLFIDIDRLKVVNDSLGHGVGDEVLVRLAARFRQVTAERAIVGRFGGDEFVVVAPGLGDLGDAIAMAQALLRSLGKPMQAGDVELRMDASVGVAFARSTELVDAADLIRDADAAMYESKRTGGSSYSVFDDRLRIEAVDRLLVEESLSQAVQLEEIETWFQPIVDVETMRLVSLEALVRWRSDDQGVVSPQRFLPVALETGLIVPIGDWVLNEACEVAAGLGPDVDVAVNLSERELADPRCLHRVLAALRASDIDPSRLTLEISEDLMIDRLAHSIALLRTMHNSGMRLSIDDFGTGRSSLSYVKRLDMISELKIDRSFVADIASSEADRAIVAALIAMTTSLGMEVVAEGVETDAQLDLLRDLGVRRMQGFYFGRPMPRDMTVAMIGGRAPETSDVGAPGQRERNADGRSAASKPAGTAPVVTY